MIAFAAVRYFSDDIQGGSSFVTGVCSKFVVMLFCCLYDFR
jgi:hypothetical protein